MRIVTDTKSVQRNVTIGKYATTGGLLLLFGALLLNIYALSRPQETQLIIIVFAAFLIGYTLSNIGGMLNLRWGRRPDVGLSEALRGLDDRHTLYNWRLGASHVLVAPSGVYTLLPKYQSGPITYEGGKWKNPGSRTTFLNFFAPRDALGNPTTETRLEVEALTNFVKKHAPEVEIEPRPIVVFLNARAILATDEAPVTTLHVKQLKDYIRRQPKGPTLPASTLAALEAKAGIASPKTAE